MPSRRKERIDHHDRFTESDRARDYSSFSEGYRIGARQAPLLVAVRDASASVTPAAVVEALDAALEVTMEPGGA